MTHEWKPGDVGVSVPFGYRGIFVGGWCGVHDRKGCWHNESGMADHADDNRRPLVVIDPEDREQVERLADLYTAAEDPRVNTASLHRIDAMQAALRSLITPPHPEEPTGLGAVVEDEEGRLFVRVADHRDGWMVDRQWQRIGGELNALRNFGWSDITAVRILSEGIKP